MHSYFLVPVPNENEFAVFAHIKDRVYTNFNEIRCEIEAETDRLGGKKVEFIFQVYQNSFVFLIQNIYKEPITLKIYSPKVVTLTLIDLPGFTKV